MIVDNACHIYTFFRLLNLIVYHDFNMTVFNISIKSFQREKNVTDDKLQ